MDEQDYPVNSLRICVDIPEEPALRGRIYGVALQDPLDFDGMLDFIIKVDDAYNAIGQPQQSQVLRSFTQPKEYTPYVPRPERYFTGDHIDQWLGEHATIEILMTSRRGAEWQGLIKDMNKRIIGRYRTVLECTNILKEIQVIA